MVLTIVALVCIKGFDDTKGPHPLIVVVYCLFSCIQSCPPSAAQGDEIRAYCIVLDTLEQCLAKVRGGWG